MRLIQPSGALLVEGRRGLKVAGALLLALILALLCVVSLSLSSFGSRPASAQTAPSKGQAYAWGNNDAGQLGDGTYYSRNPAVQVSGLSGVVNVAGGQYHSLALKSDGTVYAWGDNYLGQLGDGTNTNRNTPVQVSGLTGAVAVAAGQYHSLAAKSDGTVYAWGDNSNGQLGDGTNTNRNTPVQVSGLTGVVAVAAGQYHSLAVKSDGTVWAWGNNSNGQLGDGTNTNRNTPVQVSGLTGVVAVAAGQNHSLAVKSDGTVWAWGYNGHGQLGDGTYTSRNTPVQVNGLSDVKSVAGGSYHSLAVKNSGTVYAWGYNYEGQLGDGTGIDHNTPVQVSGLSDAKAVAGGHIHSLALKNDGTVYAWGYNGYGQLGDGTSNWHYAPVQVSGLSDVATLAAGSDHSLAATTPTTAYDQDDSDRTDYGLWAYYSNPNFSKGYSSYSDFKNDSATFSFSGSSVTWKTDKLPDDGIAKVLLDGQQVATFDAYSSTPQYDVTGFSKSDLSGGDHTLKIVVSGTKNQSSNDAFVEIDRFIVDGTDYQENSTNICYGPWCGKQDSNASGGSYRYSTSTSQSAWFYSFTGPYVELLTAKGPTRGVASVKVYDASNYALVKEVDPNLNASAVQWQSPVRVEGLDPSKEYYLTVTSTDGKEVLVDGYNAFPYQAQQGASPMALSAASTSSGESTKGTTERPPRPKQEEQQQKGGDTNKHKGSKHKH